MKRTVRINHEISAKEVRVILEDGTNLGVLSTGQALAKANELGADLIEVSPTAAPPVARIMDYGKYEYQESKKRKVARAKARQVETKNLQIRIATGQHDLELKARQASGFLREGHRVRIELYLRGRAKSLDKNFLKERLERILHLLSEDYLIADPIKPSAKGINLIIERAGKEQEK